MNSSLFLSCQTHAWVIQWSYWIPWAALSAAVALGIACFAVELRRRCFRWLLLYAGLLALHPGWSLLSREELFEGVMHIRADCGYMGRALSIFLLAASLAISVIVFRHSSVRRRTFVFGFAAAFTFMSILGEFFDITDLDHAIPHEVYASVFTGFGGRPHELLLFILVCVLLFVVRRFRFRRAV